MAYELTHNGQSKIYNYTGGIQSIQLLPGTYTLEVWGAQGGNDNYEGGYGGYAKGNYTVNSKTTIYIVVGGKGGSKPSTNAGGYNGGGRGGTTLRNLFGAGGGGATHIATATGTLSSLSSNRKAILIVAGGGGGADGNDTSQIYATSTGGGTSGGGANPGTQTSGYSFGQGGNGSSNAGGGGGGYYGGYGCSGTTGSRNAGSGGSGYIGGVKNGSMQNGVRRDNGYAIITAVQIQGVTIDVTAGIEHAESDYQKDVTQIGDIVNFTASLKPGYHFLHWISSDNIIESTNLSFQRYLYEDWYGVTAVAEPDTDTPYVVNHFIMNDDFQTYSLHKIETLQGTTNTKVTPNTLQLEHYVIPALQTVNIDGDGTTIVNYRYDRQKYHLTVTAAPAGGANTSLFNEDAYWGKAFALTVQTLPGYRFNGWVNKDTGDIFANPQIYPFNMPTEPLRLEPSFTALEVEYVVNYKLLGDDLITYETYQTETILGTTDTKVTPNVRSYNYYVSPAAQTVNINGDGSTVVNYLYNRMTYTLNLTADTGKNTMYSPSTIHTWGETINIDITTLPGYAFDEWINTDDNSLCANTASYQFIMPHQNLFLHANMHPFAVKYLVKHNIETFTSGQYSVRDIEEFYAITDTQVIPSLKVYDGFQASSVPLSVNVNGDESTIVNYYYTRLRYKLTIKYTDSNITENDYLFEQNIDLFFNNKTNLDPLYKFDHWYTNANDLFIKRPYAVKTSFLMPAHDSYIEAIIEDNRKNTNIYKNIFPEDVFNMDIAYAYEKQIINTSFDITQEHHGFIVGNVLCLIDGVYHKAKAENSPYGFPVGIVNKVIDENQFQLITSGIMTYPNQTFTDTSVMYLTNLQAGGITHYKNITNKVYIPVGFYINGKLLVHIQQGSVGDEMAPYQKHDSVMFDTYDQSELDACINQVLSNF